MRLDRGNVIGRRFALVRFAGLVRAVDEVQELGACLPEEAIFFVARGEVEQGAGSRVHPVARGESIARGLGLAAGE